MREALYKSGDLVHTLQKERGCISMFLCSEGKLFAKRMTAQFAVTDSALKSLAEGLERWAYTQELKPAQIEKLKTLSVLYEELPEFRKTVYAQKITPSHMIDHYSHQLIGPLIQTMVEIALFMQGHDPTFVSAYNAFLQWKERVGLERAITVRGYVKYSFHNTEFLERVLFLLSEQGNYRKTFLALANDEQKKLVQKVLNGEASTKLKKLHEKLAQSPESAELFEITPETWFDMITAKIDALQTVEKKLVDTLAMKSRDACDDADITATKEHEIKKTFGDYSYLINALQIFADLSPKNLNSLLGYGQIREFNKGKILFLEGEHANRLYIILNGWVKIFKGTSAGDETILQMLSSGDSIMESAVFLNTSFPVSAQIAEDATLLSMPAPVIREQIKSNNELALNLLTSMSHRSQGLIRQIEDARLKSVDERIGWFLLRLLLVQGFNSRSVKLPYDKSLIASYLDMKRETFSRSLQRLKAKGFKIENDTITIPGLKSLCGFCDSDTEHLCPLHGTADCPECRLEQE